MGAAIGAGLGSGIFKDTSEAFKNLQVIDTIMPNPELVEIYKATNKKWIACIN
jgi:sugar (pentulose or hexulose) kinase